MWHISSFAAVGSWVRTAAVGGWCGRRGGPGPDSFLSRAAKIPPASPFLDSFDAPHSRPEALQAPTAAVDNQHTSLACSSCTRGGVGGLVRKVLDEGSRVLGRFCFHLTGLCCTWLLSLSSNFVYMHLKKKNDCLTSPPTHTHTSQPHLSFVGLSD